MRSHLATLLALALLLTSLSARLARAGSEIELAVIVHATNRVERLGHHELEALFTRSQTRWDDGTPVVPLNALPGSPSRLTFDGVVLGLKADQVGRFWLDRRIRGLGMPPKQVPDPNLARRVVEQLREAIAYVPGGYATGRVKIVAWIRQGKVVAP